MSKTKIIHDYNKKRIFLSKKVKKLSCIKTLKGVFFSKIRNIFLFQSVFLYIIFILSLTSCLDKGSQGEIPMKLENNISEIEATLSSSSRNFVKFELLPSIVSEANIIKFEIIASGGEIEISDIEKLNFSDENFIVSQKISGGYRVIFSDFKDISNDKYENYLKKKEKFAKITLSKISGSDIIVELKNYQKE